MNFDGGPVTWPSLTSDVREHEWIGVHQLRLDRKRRRRASVLMRPPYCLVIRGNRGRSDHASARTRPPLSPPSCAPRTALVHRSVAAAEYITDPMMQLITNGNDQSESTSGLFIPIHG